MIRQLGPPTFFVTFTNAEQNWLPLTQTLEHLYMSHYSKSTQNQPDSSLEVNIFSLIKKDLITCTHYYKHRIIAMKQLLCSDTTFFGKVLDYFLVT